MIGEHLDVLPDVLPHRPAVTDLRNFANVDFYFIFFSTTKQLIKFWSTKSLLVD